MKSTITQEALNEKVLECSYPNDKKSFTCGLTGFCKPRLEKHDSGKMKKQTRLPSQDELTERILGCSYGEYPWDDWQAEAIKKDVSEELAILGRAVMREAYQHNWDDNLKSLCGWADDGKRMIALAIRSPERAKKRWERLLDTDGNRGHYEAKTGEWVSHI